MSLGFIFMAFATFFPTALAGALKPTPGIERFACINFDLTELTTFCVGLETFNSLPDNAADWRRESGFCAGGSGAGLIPVGFFDIIGGIIGYLHMDLRYCFFFSFTFFPASTFSRPSAAEEAVERAPDV